MDFKKLIPILGLLILILFLAGTATASDIDISDGFDDSSSDMGFTAEVRGCEKCSMECVGCEKNFNSMEHDFDENIGIIDLDNDVNEDNSLNEDKNINEDNAVIYDKERISNVKNDLKASKLASVYRITQNDYSDYFNNSGNILSNVNAGDTLDFSGLFKSKDFVINIPLNVTSTDGSANFINCSFNFTAGSDGSNISNLKINSSRTGAPLLYLDTVSNMTIINNNIFSAGSKSYALCFSNVSNSKVFYNTFQTTAFVTGWGHPSALALAGSLNNNISSNNVIVNDSNGIYFTAYVGDSINPNLVNANNYIYNNTVHSVRGVEWALDDNGNVPVPSSFCYAIQIMGDANQVINNTVYNAYRGISSTGSNSIVSGNIVHDIRGTWYSGNTNEEGGEFAISAGTHSIVENNTIYNSHLNKTSGAAISVGSNSIVSNNNLTNIEGLGADLSKNNITFNENSLKNVSGDGVRVKGAYGNITISNNEINSTGNSISLVKANKAKYPSDIYIENNELYSENGVLIYYEEQYMGHLVIDGVTIIPAGETSKSTVTTVALDPNTVELGDSVVISPSVTCDGSLITGLVDILVDGVKVASVDIGTNYTYTPAEVGNFNVSARFIAAGEYNDSASDIVVLTVNPAVIVPKDTECSIIVNPINVTVGDSVKISPSVTCDGSLVDGYVDILLDGVKLDSVNIGSNYTYVPSELGSFNLSASFAATEYYNPSVSDITVLTVNPKDTICSIVLSSDIVEVNGTVLVTPSVTCDGSLVDGSVDILVDGVKVASVDIGSSYRYVPSEEGTFNISASFAAVGIYADSISDVESLTVNPKNNSQGEVTGPNATVTTVSINPNAVDVNGTVFITPSVTCDGSLVDGSVDILVDGVKLASVDIGSSYRYVPLEEGSFNVSASFAATEYYNASVSDIVVLTVNPISNSTGDNGTEENGTDGNSTEGNSTEGNSTEGNSTEGNSTEGNSTEGNSTDNGTETNDTNSSIIVINDDNYYDYFGTDGYPVNLSYEGNYTILIDRLNNKNIIIPSGSNINITGEDESGIINNGTIYIGDGSDEFDSVLISGLTFNNYNKDAININEIAYDVAVENNKISITAEATKDNPYFSVYGVNAIGYIDSLTVKNNDISVEGTAPYLYGVQLGGYGAIANPEDIKIINNTIKMNSTANMGMAEGIYLDSPINAVVLDNTIDIESINDVYAYGIQIADSAYIAIGEGKSNVKSPYNLLVQSNDLNLKSEYMVYGITILNYGCDGTVDDMGKAKTNMLDLNTTIIENRLVANSTKAVMGIVGKTYNMSVLSNNISVFGGSIDGVASHDALGVDNYALGVQYSPGGDYKVLVKDNYGETNVKAEFLNNEAYKDFVSFVDNMILSTSNETIPNETDDNGTDNNGTGDNGTDNNGTGDNGTNSTVKTAKDLQNLIDNALNGSVVDLGNYEYANVSDINITKDIKIIGNNTVISTAGDSKVVFNIEEGLSSVSITGIEFKVNNGDVLVRAKASNSTDPLAIETPEINIMNNTVIKANDDVVAESVKVLELRSERGILAPTKEIKVSNNTLESGMDPFSFVVESVINSSDVQINPGGDLQDRIETAIHYEDMNTVAINQKIEGRVGKYFEVNLTDKEGNPLADKLVQIGFNGAIYNRTTNATGGARLQINLGYKGTYTFAVSYLGDDKYNGSFIVAKIVVSTQKTKLTTAKKTYKANAKTKTLTATLKDASGHVISGKKVSFTVNGKTYSATTNAKGVATVKVSLSTKKTYGFTAKYAGDNMYTASSVSGKVTIK